MDGGLITMSTHDGKRRKTAALLQPQQRRRRQKKAVSGSRQITIHKALEVILMRQLADCLAMPVFIVNGEGTLLFYNEPAERLLGQRFEETGELSTTEWSTAFVPTDHFGNPLPPEKLPLVIALRQRRPAHADFRIRGFDGVVRHIQVTAFPLAGRANRFLGAVAIFWEVPKLP
jgi:PAS domain-containing protein